MSYQLFPSTKSPQYLKNKNGAGGVCTVGNIDPRVCYSSDYPCFEELDNIDVCYNTEGNVFITTPKPKTLRKTPRGSKNRSSSSPSRSVLRYKLSRSPARQTPRSRQTPRTGRSRQTHSQASRTRRSRNTRISRNSSRA